MYADIELMNGEGGPVKRTATWFAEKIADLMLGGDVLDPRRDGTDIDWEGIKVEKPRQTIVATLARIQLELALGAANRRLKEEMDPKGCAELVAKAKALEEDENFALKLTDSCSITITALPDSKLEASVSGSGVAFEVLCDELWNRSSAIKEESGKTIPGLAVTPGA